MATSNKTMHIVLWVLQVLLGLMFLMAGIFRLSTPIDELGEQIPWVLEYPMLLKISTIAELFGAIGLILPSALRIQPKLTVLAAYGLALVMLLAALFHASRGEYEMIPTNLVLLALTLFIAWGRTKKAPIEAK